MNLVDRLLVIVALAAAAAGSGFAGSPGSASGAAERFAYFQPEYTMSEHLQ